MWVTLQFGQSQDYKIIYVFFRILHRYKQLWVLLNLADSAHTQKFIKLNQQCLWKNKFKEIIAESETLQDFIF